MSRSWRDRLLVSLEPAALRWVRLAGAWAHRVTDQRSIEVDPADGRGAWHGAAGALGRAAESWRGERLRVSVVLSNHFVRYAIVPAPGGASGPDEEQALARFHFARIHGERAQAWELRLGRGRSGSPRLACAIDKDLFAAVKSCFPAQSRARLVSLQPYLMSAFNLWRSRMPKAGAWFLLPEDGRACLALHARGAWRAVQNVRGAFLAPQDWEALLERERHRAGVDAGPRTLLARADSRALAALREVRGWNVTGLATVDERYAIGWTAQ